MKPLLVIALIALAGCAPLASVTPSLQFCSDVTYKRTGNQIDLSAKCAAPIGDSLLK